MAERAEKKKWVSPKLIGLGKLSEVEDNGQIKPMAKDFLIDLRDNLSTESVKGKNSAAR